MSQAAEPSGNRLGCRGCHDVFGIWELVLYVIIRVHNDSLVLFISLANALSTFSIASLAGINSVSFI